MVLDVVLVVEDGCDAEGAGVMVLEDGLADVAVAGSVLVCAWAAAAATSMEEITIARWFLRIFNTLLGTDSL